MVAATQPFIEQPPASAITFEYLFEADGTSLNADIATELADGVMTIGSRVVWLSRMPMSSYANNVPRGGATGTIQAAGTDTADGGSVIDIPGFQIKVRLGELTNIYQWPGVDGQGSETAEAAIAAIAYLKARGGGTLDFVGGTHQITNVVELADCHHINIISSESRALLRKAIAEVATNTHIFHISSGSTDIEIRDMETKGNFTELTASTGSSPGILIGDYITETGLNSRPNVDEVNDNIRIKNMHMSGHNWACIAVYGRQVPAVSSTQKNTNVLIENCVLSKSGNGVFVYKNAEHVVIQRNTIFDTAQDSIILDTRAASDSDVSLPILSSVVVDNTCWGFGSREQGIGILAKGDVRFFLFARNKVYDPKTVQASNPPLNSGIFIGPDFGGLAPCKAQVTLNNINNIQAQGANGYGIYIGADCKQIEVSYNTIDDCKTYCFFGGAGTDMNVHHNIFKGARQGYAATACRGTAGNPIIYVEWWRNEFIEELNQTDGLGTSFHQWFEHVTALHEGAGTVTPDAGSSKPFTELAATGIATRYSGLSMVTV